MISAPRISVIIPARNEERYLPACLSAIVEARTHCEPGTEVEIIVVLNRCTDSTEAIALAAGCQTVIDDSKNLSQIRNAGARIASGDILVTVDADSKMSKFMLRDILRKLAGSKVVGGGVLMLPERWSVGIVLTGLCLVPVALWYGGISGGVFYCRREDFVAIGGFDEGRVSAEDIDFADRLRKYGKSKGQRFVTIFSSWIVTSCRKFDRFGDWYFLTHPREMVVALKGQDQQIADRVWYDFER